MKINRNITERAGENPAGLIVWNGGCIPCLNIEDGDFLDQVVHNIATKVCELAAPLNVSTLSLQCALDIFNKDEIGDRTITKVLQLLIDNECGLKELIDTIQAQINGLSSKILILNLRCLAEFDGSGNQLPYNEQTVLQSLINNFCDLKSNVTTLTGNLSTLKTRVDNLVIPSGDERIVTTTISGPKVVSQALIDVSKNYTDYKLIIGTEAQVQTAISRQTSQMNSIMLGTTGWITTPTTEAQLISNQALLLQYLLSNVENIKRNCCNNSCDDITVGFITSFDNNTVILQFTSGAGTHIPTGYTDCGSKLTITNQLGTSFNVLIIVSQGGETEEIDVSMFKKGDTLTFDIDVKLCSETDNCQKCVSKTVQYSNDCCTITNSSSDPVVFIYSVTTITTT